MTVRQVVEGVGCNNALIENIDNSTTIDTIKHQHDEVINFIYDHEDDILWLTIKE